MSIEKPTSAVVVLLRQIAREVIAECDFVEEKVKDGRGGMRSKWPEETEGMPNPQKTKAVCETFLFITEGLK